MDPISGPGSPVRGGALRVFLSHTSELRAFPPDRSFLAAAEAAVMRAGHAVVDMAYFAARDSAPADTCIAKVREAQVYVGIVGGRYGTPVGGRPDVSYTELEFETATSLRMPRLVFLVDEDALPASHSGEAPELANRQQAFRRRLLDDAGLTVAWVTSPADLEVGLVHALLEMGSRSEAMAVATRTLPRSVATFTGRERELERLLATVSDAARRGGAVAITAIDGMAGVGKTAFAIHAAHRLAAEFPDGQLFLDLHTHAAGRRPVAAGDVLGSVLLTLGVAPQAIPADVDARAALWRDRLSGKRTLVLLDDAAGHEQVRPLLPGTPGCLVLITSRRRLAGLEDLQSLTLGTLPADEAAGMFTRLVGAHRDADPAAVADLVELCDYLPLAIGLVAGRLRSHGSWSAWHLVDLLRDAHDRLSEIRAENTTVEAAFELSYRDLDADQQRLFRRLGLHPGLEIDAYAAAALDGTGISLARRGLEALYDDHLIVEPVQARYRLHDLIRDYARSLVSQDDSAENDLAVDRLLDYYLATTTTARRQRESVSDITIPLVAHLPAAVPDLSTPRTALAWLDAERANLGACVTFAVASGRYMHAVRLASGMRSYLRIEGHWDQAAAIHGAALTAARLVGDRTGQAHAVSDLGVAQRLTNDYVAATASLTEGLTHFRELGDLPGQASALRELGIVQRLNGDYPAAVTSLTAALAVFRSLDERSGWAQSLNELGVAQGAVGEYSAAVASLTEALALFRELDDERGEATAQYYLGDVHRVGSDYGAAVPALTLALARYRHLGHRLGQANALNSLGLVQIEMGEHSTAIANLVEALALFSEMGNWHGRANALSDLGLVQHRTGHHAAGTAYLTEALAVYGAVGNRHGQAEALNRLGALLLDSSGHGIAINRHQEALRLAQEAGVPLEEARALEGIGNCLLRFDNIPDGAAHLRQALVIYQRLGVPDAERVAAALGSAGASASVSD